MICETDQVDLLREIIRNLARLQIAGKKAVKIVFGHISWSRLAQLASSCMPCDLMGKKNKTAAKSVEAQYSLAASFRRNGKLQQAIESYLRVVEADPKHIDALKELGLLLRSVGRSHDALKYVVQAVMLEPLNGELLGDLGETWQSTGHLPKAIAAYQKALELKPGLSRVLYSLGCAQIETGEFVPARASFEEALIAEPNWLEARHNLGRALYEMGEVSAAFSQFERCAGLTERKESERARAMAAVVVPGVPEVNNEKILAIRRRWAETDLSLPQDSILRAFYQRWWAFTCRVCVVVFWWSELDEAGLGTD